MSTPSTLLLCAGAAASLAGVWTLAGLSERSGLRSTPRVMVAAAVGLLGEVLVYGRVPAEARAELALPLLFGLASVLALVVGAAKIDAALADRDGPRVVRRAAGIVAGTFFGMAAVGGTSLVSSSAALAPLSQARLGWALMFALLAAVLVVFAQRVRYVGMGLLRLGPRALGLGVLAVALLVGAFVTAGRARLAAVPVEPGRAANAVVSAAAPEAPSSAVAPPPVTAVAPALSAPASASAEAPSTSAAPSTSTPTPAGQPGAIKIEVVTARGMLEADVRGGVERRMDKLQACQADPKNAQVGSISLKVGIDPGGSVSYSKALGGELAGTPLGTCLLAVFYKMGFAAPASGGAYFEITLRAP